MRWGLVTLALAVGAWGQAFQPAPAIHTVFIIVMENMQWSDILGSPQAPFINNTLLPQAAHAEQYMGIPYLHPSLPNYLVLEAGTNFGITNDSPPAINAQYTTQHLTAGIEAAGLTWKAWVEDISGNNCPLTDINLYSDAVNPTVFFHDVIDSSANCIAHERPFAELATALGNNTAPNLNWIIPDLCDDAHSCPLSTGDQWLSQVVGMIQNSRAYQDGGAIFITWDETEDGVEDQPLGLIVASPAAKAGYENAITYTHASTLRTIEEIFHLPTFFAQAATANDLSDLFNTASLSVSPQSLAFAPQAVGTTSAAQTVTVTNQGASAVAISAIAASGDFSQSNACAASLGAGASCSIQVTFTPTNTNPETGQLTLNDGAPSSPQVVGLTGEGLGGSVQLSAPSLDFGQLAVGATSAPQALTVTNGGGAALTLNGISASRPFEQSGDCPAQLAAGASCTLQIRFAPTAPETSQGTLTLQDTAANSPQQVGLSGTGQGALAVLSAEALNFGDLAVGSTGAAQSVTVESGGNIALLMNPATITGPFTLTSGCGATLDPEAKCGLHVQFVPTAPGAATGTLTVSDNAPDAPETVDLTGNGLGAVATLASTQLDFGGQTVGAGGTPMTLAITNTGNAALVVGAAQASGPFSANSGCSAPVAPQASCAITVQFTPAAAGAAAGTLSLSDNAPDSPQTIALSGSGLEAAAQLGASALAFGDQAVGVASPAQTLVVSNPGTAPLTVSSIQASGDFTAVSACAQPLAPGASCAIAVQFAPQSVGAATGALVVSDNVGTQSVELSGTGLGAVVQLGSASLQLGTQLAGTLGAAMAVTVTNRGNAPLQLSAAQVSGPFAAIPACPAPVAPAAGCTVAVQFAPTAPGPATGVLTLTDNAGVQTVALAGTGSDVTLTAANGGDWSVASGQTSAGSVVVASEDGFADPNLTLQCNQAPAPASCTVAPGTLALAANAQTSAQVVIATQAAAPMPGGWWPLGFIALALLGLCRGERRRRWALVPLLVGLSGCGGMPAPPRVAPGSYTMQLVATTSSGATRTLPLTLHVQ